MSSTPTGYSLIAAAYSDSIARAVLAAAALAGVDPKLIKAVPERGGYYVPDAVAAVYSPSLDPGPSFGGNEGDLLAQLRTSLAATSATLWKTNTAYAAGQAVVNPAGFIVTALTGFTSGSSYNAANWSDPVAATYLPLTTALLDWAYSQSYRLVSATRDANEAITTGSVVWPDGATGTFTTDTPSTAFPGAIDAYHVTHVLNGTTLTVTQTAVTRDAGGAVTAQPALTVA